MLFFRVSTAFVALSASVICEYSSVVPFDLVNFFESNLLALRVSSVIDPCFLVTLLEIFWLLASNASKVTVFKSAETVNFTLLLSGFEPSRVPEPLFLSEVPLSST